MRTNFASLVFFSWYTIYEWISDCKASPGAPRIARKLRHWAKIVLFIVAGTARIAGLSIAFTECRRTPIGCG